MNNWINDAYFPTQYPQIHLQIARERGLDPNAVMVAAELDPALLNDPSMKISPQDFGQLILAIVALSGDNGLGLEVGWREPPTAHGNLGYALLCSENLIQAAEILQRFRHLRGRGMLFNFSAQDNWYCVEFRLEYPFPDPLCKVTFESVIGSFYRCVQILLADNHSPGEIWFTHSQPAYFERFSDRFPHTRFDMPVALIRIPVALMQQTLPMHNPQALALALDMCEREAMLQRERPDAVLVWVQEAMALQAQGYPEAEALADALHLSVRTLRRKLQAHGLNYKHLLEDARRRDAMRLLESGTLEIQKIATLLGYSNPANFTRAFRVWTGRSPSEYRALRQPAQRGNA